MNVLLTVVHSSYITPLVGNLYRRLHRWLWQSRISHRGEGMGKGLSTPKVGAPTYYFGQFFLKTAWKWKKLELDRGGAGSSMSARQVDCVWGLEYSTYFIFVVITTEKTNILLRYLHQQWDKKVGKQSWHQINYNTTSFLKLDNLSDNSHCI